MYCTLRIFSFCQFCDGFLMEFHAIHVYTTFFCCSAKLAGQSRSRKSASSCNYFNHPVGRISGIERVIFRPLFRHYIPRSFVYITRSKFLNFLTCSLISPSRRTSWWTRWSACQSSLNRSKTCRKIGPRSRYRLVGPYPMNELSKKKKKKEKKGKRNPRHEDDPSPW